MKGAPDTAGGAGQSLQMPGARCRPGQPQAQSPWPGASTQVAPSTFKPLAHQLAGAQGRGVGPLALVAPAAVAVAIAAVLEDVQALRWEQHSVRTAMLSKVPVEQACYIAVQSSPACKPRSGSWAASASCTTAARQAGADTRPAKHEHSRHSRLSSHFCRHPGRRSPRSFRSTAGWRPCSSCCVKCTAGWRWHTCGVGMWAGGVCVG